MKEEGRKGSQQAIPRPYRPCCFLRCRKKSVLDFPQIASSQGTCAGKAIGINRSRNRLLDILAIISLLSSTWLYSTFNIPTSVYLNVAADPSPKPRFGGKSYILRMHSIFQGLRAIRSKEDYAKPSDSPLRSATGARDRTRLLRGARI